MAKDICIYYKQEPENDRYIKGDGLIIPILRNLIKGRKTGGVEKVFINLCKSFTLSGIPYKVNKDFKQLKPDDKVIVLGSGKHVLTKYNKDNKIIAGIGLMTHPSEWPTLCTDFPVVKYLQHSDWATQVYKPYFGQTICDNWFAGIETDKWSPLTIQKDIDILIYYKIRWNQEILDENLLKPIINSIETKGLNYQMIKYGFYNEDEYFNLLNRSKMMIFLCEHESQGFACCEAMSMNVPVLAWDQGFCLDPNRFKWGNPEIPATSVPFFDESCGLKFMNIDDFYNVFPLFIENVERKVYEPRNFVIMNLSLEKSGKRMLEILEDVYG